MKNFSIIAIICVIFCGGCVAGGTNQDRQAERDIKERYSMPIAQKRIPKQEEGSLFNAAKSKNIYEDSRAKKVGDIVTVNIVETSSGKKEAETITSRDATLQGGVSSFFGYEKLFNGKDGAHTPSLTSMNANLGKSFTGTGETTRDSTVTATLSARVLDVTMNGNLYIRGYKEIRVNNETQHIILSGIIRPSDVLSDNSVLSTKIADARIEYSGTGVLSAKQQPGWLANLIDVVWPF